MCECAVQCLLGIPVRPAPDSLSFPYHIGTQPNSGPTKGTRLLAIRCLHLSVRTELCNRGPPGRNRLTSIDILRVLVVVIMALDYRRAGFGDKYSVLPEETKKFRRLTRINLAP